MTTNIEKICDCHLRENFIAEDREIKTISQESLCVRILKKKFKFIMLLLAIFYILLEVIKMILGSVQYISDINAMNTTLKTICFKKYFSHNMSVQ